MLGLMLLFKSIGLRRNSTRSVALLPGSVLAELQCVREVRETNAFARGAGSVEPAWWSGPVGVVHFKWSHQASTVCERTFENIEVVETSWNSEMCGTCKAEVGRRQPSHD
jgi:hypothetical protein